MRPRNFIFIACLILSFLAGRAASPSVARADAGHTAIVADEKSASLRIMAGGKQVAWFDRDGLHVLQSIEYGGTITDTGAQFLKHKAEAARAQ